MGIDARARTPVTSTPDAPPANPAAGTAARAGMFVAGFFMLGLANWLFWSIVGAPSDLDGVGRPKALFVGAAAVVMAGTMLRLAARMRGTDNEPFGVMAAFGVAEYVTVAATAFGYTAGLSGEPLLWTVLVLSVPALTAILIWFAHPVLGWSVGVGVIIAVMAMPVGVDGAGEFATRALLIGLIEWMIAIAVDLRTRSRAGSVLHYIGVTAFAIGTLSGLSSVGAGLGPIVAALLASFELSTAVMLRRRSWAYLGWLTLALAVAETLGAVLAIVGLDGRAFELSAPLLVMAAIWMRRHEEALRARVLAGLPAELVDRFPR